MRKSNQPACLRGAASLGLISLAVPVLAAAPDAGQTLRDITPVLPEVRRTIPSLRIDGDDTAQAADSTRFLVRRIRVVGSKAFKAEELEALVADWTGKELSLADLRAASRKLTAFYRSKGYLLARAHIPAQQVRDGIVTMSIVKGTLGKVRVGGGASAVPDRAVDLAATLPTGEPLMTADTNRLLLLLSDMPGIAGVDASLRPGEQVGSSDLDVALKMSPALEGELSLDNHGGQATGAYRATAMVSANNLAGLGDRLQLAVVQSDDGLTYGRLAWDGLLSTTGLRLGASYSRMRYELGAAFANLNAYGTAETAALYGSYPLVRDLDTNLALSFALEDRRLDDRIGATATETDKRALVASLGLGWDWTDQLGSGGRNALRLTAFAGDLRIETPAALAIDAASARTQGRYDKVVFRASRVQALMPETQLYFALNGQWAGKNLDSSEKFSIGGATAVRAYPVGEANGDTGWLATLELRRQLTPALQGIAFYDAGEVRFNREVFAAGSNQRRLAGYGIGGLMQWGDFSLRATAAWRDTGAATAESERKPRLWGQAAWRF